MCKIKENLLLIFIVLCINLKKDVIKKFKYIIWGSLFFLWLVFFMPAGLLSIPWIQKKISEIASERLRTTLGVPVSIGNIDFEPFNKLILKDLYLEDQQGDTLFQAKRLGVGFEFLPLFKGKIRIRSAQLFSFQFNLSKENDQSPLNLQFVIDAFASKDTTKRETNIDLAIRNFIMRRGTFTFRVKDAPETQGKFNAKDLRFTDISSKIHVEKLTNSELVANIERLILKEQSGIVVRRIALGLDFSKDSAAISNLEILLPNSSLTLENVLADFRNVPDSGSYIKDSEIALQISPSNVCLKDFRAFVPAFANFKDLLNISGKVSGKINDLQLTDFFLTNTNKLTFQANLAVKNLADEKDIYISGAVENSFIPAAEIEKIANNFSKNPIHFPEPVLRLGNIRFEGKISGLLRNLTAFGLFNTDVGSIRTDITIGSAQTNFIKGEIQSHDLNLRKFLASDDYGMADFNIHIDAQQNRNNKYEGNVNARVNSIEFKRYTYENIDLKGSFTENSFNGILNIDSPDGKLSSEGFVRLDGSNSIFNFSAQVEHVKLDRLNLSTKYKNSRLSFNVNVDVTGNNIDNLLGHIKLTNTRFATEKGRFRLDSLIVSSYVTETNNKVLSIHSDLIAGNIVGNYSFRDIVPAFRETGNLFLPALVKVPGRKVTSENNFEMAINIQDLEKLANVLDLPFVLYDNVKIQGNYNHASSKFNLEISLPKWSVNKMQLKDCSIKLENKNNTEALLLVNATQLKNDKTNRIAATFNVSNNNIDSKLKWNDKSDQYNGIFNILTKLTERTGEFPLKTEINISESEATFKGAVWNINPSQIVLDSAKIKIKRLYVGHADQFAAIGGVISRNPEDSLRIDLNKVNLAYIFDILNLKPFEMGGIVSGHAVAKDIYNTRQLSTLLNVENFSFNKAVLGNLNLLGIWDDEQEGIRMLGDVYKNDSSNMQITGMLAPVKGMLDFKFKAQNVDASFLRRYLNDVAKDISGEISGEINLFGSFSEVTFAGDVFVKNGSFGVEFLNTTYTFSDYVYLKPDEISIRNVTFFDKFGNKAIVNGSVRHQFLSNFVFSANMNATNFLVFNATERTNPLFFGTAFGTGRLDIRGTESLINFDLNMRTNENTKITLNFMEQSDIAEFNFINFVSRTPSGTDAYLDKILSQLTNKPASIRSESGTELRFNVQLTLTPDATIDLIMDLVSGDKIRAYGQGVMNIRYGTNTELWLSGRYVIERGTYNFSFQQALFRDFQIRSGSSVTFNGDPFAATLDIIAIYSLSANISDLSQALAQQTARLNIPINAVLKIAGPMERPNISFDIEAPNSEEHIQRQIRALINTEEMMNRQIVYLLVLNRFYTPNTESVLTQRSNNELTFLASTLASQISNILGSSLGENFQVGAFYTANNADDREMSLMLSSQLLNNRLIINGNFGYRDNLARNTSFIGDVDVEVLLTKSGSIRARFYNHFNDRFYSLRSAYTTQGAGLVFMREFDNFRYIFRRRLWLASPFPAPIPMPVEKTDSVTSYLFPEDNFLRFK